MIKNRKQFWIRNIRNFEKNVSRLFPKKIGRYKIYLVASEFSGKKVMPYDYDSFSFVQLITSSKKQGYEILVFLNKARLAFLSRKALMYIIRHELEHIKQAIKYTKKYVFSVFDNKISKDLEIDAEKANKEDERKAYASESVLYCYDLGGWRKAEKMAKYLFKQDKMYCGGYDKGLSKEEYGAFLHAKKMKDIKIFIDFFS